jgi:hypothetical protein
MVIFWHILQIYSLLSHKDNKIFTNLKPQKNNSNLKKRLLLLIGAGTSRRLTVREGILPLL